MPAIADQAVCIRHWDWSETSQTVSLFCRTLGLVRGVAKGAKRENARFSGGLEVPTRGEVLVIPKAAGSLATLTAWDQQETFPALRRSLSAFYSAMYMADLVGHLLTEHDPHPRLFDDLLASLRALDPAASGGPGDRLAVLRFQWSALVEAGYRPELAQDVVTGRPLEEAATYGFSSALGGVTADPSLPRPERAPGAHRTGPIWRVRRETIDLLRTIPGPGDPFGGAAEPTSPDTVARSARLLAFHLREVLGRDLPSAGVLFGDHGGALPQI